jgi:hypothetical protein
VELPPRPWTSHVRWIESNKNNPDYVFATIEPEFKQSDAVYNLERYSVNSERAANRAQWWLGYINKQ